MLDEVFGIRISQGAIANMLVRAGTPLTAAAETTAAAVRSSAVVASDETSARVEGKNWWQWLLLSSTAIHHLIPTGQARGLKAHDSRGATVLTEFLGETKPDVWVADRYAAQAGHGSERQLCLAHLLRDTQYAIDAGDTGFAPGLQKLLRRAIAIGQRRPELKSLPLRRQGTPPSPSTVPTPAFAGAGSRPQARPAARRQPHCRGRPQARSRHPQMPRRSLCLHHSPRRSRHQQRLRACPAPQRDLPQMPAPAKAGVTGGFRSEWGAHTYADALSVIATGRLHGRSAFHALRDALAGRPILVPP